ncbi:uncharacterized protein LOC112557908 [Pomacea canaliculata]|uniref:uncharacterized protein LOC112557908 n=1 Tax=Pomacea canaliculata TaxID=400727 RepID=UPI000D72E556|nr:uncharacterized protein LOC112557908 [Pomacea canaliculata]
MNKQKPLSSLTMLHLFLLALGITQVTGEVTATISSHWQGGFQGKACLPVEKEMHGWKIRLVFDQPVSSLEVYTSEVVEKSANNQEYVLGNKAWNAEEHVGDTLCVEFQGHSSGDISPVITAYFEGEAGPRATSGPGPTSGPGTQVDTTPAPEVKLKHLWGKASWRR